MAPLTLLELDQHTAAHLAVAIERHWQAMRDGPYPPPMAFVKLGEMMTRRARTGQDEPNLREVPAVPDAAPMTKLLLTKREAADLLGISERTVGRLLTAGELPSVSVGRATRIRREDLEQYVDRLDGGMHVETKAG